jgi:hypothetical protein
VQLATKQAAVADQLEVLSSAPYDATFRSSCGSPSTSLSSRVQNGSICTQMRLAAVEASVGKYSAIWAA